MFYFSEQNGLILVKKEDISGININNAHIFNGKYSSAGWTFTERISRCGEVELKKHTSPITAIIKEIDNQRFLHMAVEKHASPSCNVCGRCMATLFADGE